MGIGLNRGIGFPGGGGSGQPGQAAPRITGVVFDKAVGTGNQYKVLLSDGSSYTFVVPEGKTLDLSGLSDGSVPVYDAKSGKLVASGVKANKGDLIISPDSLDFGTHEMGALGENVGFTNKVTGITYSPLWQVHDANQNIGTIRAIGSLGTATRQGDYSQIIENPVFTVTVDADETVFGIRLAFAEQVPDVVVSFTKGGHPVATKVFTGPHNKGRNWVSTKPGIDFKKGDSYTIALTRSDGVPLRVKGAGPSQPFWQVRRSLWQDLIVADRDWVTQQIGNLDSQAAAARGIMGTQITNLQQDVHGKLFSMDEIVQNLKALGYLKVDGGGGADHGPKANVQAYVFFQAGRDTPTRIPSTAQVHTGETFSLQKDNDDPEYVFVVIPAAQSGQVTRVAEQGGLPAVWPKTTADIGGSQYAVMRSPSPFVERNPTFELYP